MNICLRGGYQPFTDILSVLKKVNNKSPVSRSKSKKWHLTHSWSTSRTTSLGDMVEKACSDFWENYWKECRKEK